MRHLVITPQGEQWVEDGVNEETYRRDRERERERGPVVDLEALRQQRNNDIQLIKVKAQDDPVFAALVRILNL